MSDTRTVQIRNVPEQAHRELKARAALAGQSLSEYALSELLRSLETPTLSELVARVQSHTAVELDESPAAAVRAERDAR